MNNKFIKDNFHKRIRYTILVVHISLCMALLLACNTYANGTEKNYVLQSYLEFLASPVVTIHEDGKETSSEKLRFALAYIDEDDIPELVVRYAEACHAEGYADLFYWNGEYIERIRLAFNAESKQVYLPGTGVFSDNYTGQGVGTTNYISIYDRAYHTKFYETVTAPSLQDNTFQGDIYSYYIDDQEVSEAEFYQQLLEEYGSQPEHYVFHENTAENREIISAMINEDDADIGGMEKTQHPEFCWYSISTDYEPGIAVRVSPDSESTLITRIPDGTEFFVEEVSGVWGHTHMPDYEGWIHLDYARVIEQTPSYEQGMEYIIVSDYEPGIAVRSIPSGDGELLIRIPNGTKFFVERVCGVWGYTADANGYAGWIHLDYTQPANVYGDVFFDEFYQYEDFVYTYNSSSTVAITNWLGDEGKRQVSIPREINGLKVTEISSGAFSYCHGIREVFIPDTVTEIGRNAFEGCAHLEQVSIPVSVKVIGDRAFGNCARLNMIYVSPNNPDYAVIGSVVFNKKEKSLVSYPGGLLEEEYRIPEGILSIEEEAFYSNDNLQSVIFPNSVTSIGDSAFSGCRNLRNVELPEELMSIGAYAFFMCPIPKMYIPDTVEAIGDYAFSTTGTITLEVSQGSYAAEYAEDNHVQYSYTDADDWLN